jgi:eukaryotic-like serine/threonine-protein kinase
MARKSGPFPMMGKTLTHYHIVEKIGEGGMGVVYRARDSRLERDVALKVLPAGMLADEGARRRFRKEALALSKLNHPNIATVHDFDSDAGVDFLTMELVAGESLASKIHSGPLPEKEIIPLSAQIASALDEAHEHHIVHRDLKPGNIMVTPKGQVKLLDFGLATLFEPIGTMTTAETLARTAGVAGTMPYMAPEQLQGENPDRRSDFFSFGAVLYEMATEQRPFREETVARLTEAILHQSPVSPRTLNTRISPELEQVILKCLEKEPEHRYQSAKEILADLRRLGARTSFPAAPVSRPGARRRSAVLTLAAGMAVIVGVALALSVGSLRRRLLGTASAAPIHSLAVLPLDNFSHDPEQDYFAEGMTEALITDLSKISALRVISRTSIMQYKGAKKPLPEIARELEVDAVIEGSVERAGDRVRITAQLIKAANDEHIWADSYVRDLNDVLALQDDVAREIASQVQVKLTPQEQRQLASNRSTNSEAYQLFLQGRFHWYKGDEPSLKKSIDYYREALAKDPNYALAYAGLADSYAAFSDWYLPPRQVMPMATAAATKALQIDESLAPAHNTLCWIKIIYDWDWQGAERECRRAIELNPNFADAHDNYATLLSNVGRWKEMEEELQRAERLDPLSFRTYADGSVDYWLERRYDEAVAQAQKSIELEPNGFMAHSNLAFAYAEMNRLPDAVVEAQKGAELSDSPLAKGFLGYTYAAAGRTQEARKTVKQLEADFRNHFVCPYEIGTIHLWLGEKDEAFRWYEKAYDERSICMSLMKYDPRLDPIRSDPRYESLIRRVGFPQ